MKSDTITDLFGKKVIQAQASDALCYRVDYRWKTMSWREYGLRVDNFAKALIAAGVKTGDKIALIGINSPEWFVADMAIMTMGAVSVPVYQTSSGEQIEYILAHSGSRFFIIEEITYFQRVKPYLDNLPHLKQFILQKGNTIADTDQIINLTTFLLGGEKITDEELTNIRAQVKPETIATFIYTSGTTGPPKAVMLSHKNCASAGKNVHLSIQTKIRENISCSYLPLSHVAERTVNLFTPLFSETVVYFMRGYEWFADDLREIRPTCWAGVPRVWEKLYEGVMRFKEGLPANKQKVVNWAISIGKQFNWRRYNNEAIGIGLYIKYAIARRLVIQKILTSLGLDRVEITVTGGAPTSKEILDFFMTLGIWLQDVYGQTEGHGTTSFCTKDQIRFGSAGKPFPLVEVRIAEDGEILVRGDNVADGYYKEPELSKKTFLDGWLYSGDLGFFDDDGFLWITGRKKDVIITSGGKNITPSKIESYLMDNPLIEHAVVVGDGRKYLTALLTINEETALKKAQKYGVSGEKHNILLNADFIKREIDGHVEIINQKLSRVEQIKKYRILRKSLSVEDGELTNILKIKRNVVISKYETEINELYK